MSQMETIEEKRENGQEWNQNLAQILAIDQTLGEQLQPIANFSLAAIPVSDLLAALQRIISRGDNSHDGTGINVESVPSVGPEDAETERADTPSTTGSKGFLTENGTTGDASSGILTTGSSHGTVGPEGHSKICGQDLERIQILHESDEELKHLKDKAVTERWQFHAAWILEYSRYFSDVSIYVGPDRKEIRAHRATILKIPALFDKCNELHKRRIAQIRATQDRSALRDEPRWEIFLPDSHYDCVLSIIKWAYTGELIHNEHPGYLARLYLEADSLKAQLLKVYLLRYLRGVMVSARKECDSLKVEYTLCLFRGLAHCVSSRPGTTWDDFQGILQSIAVRKEFSNCINNPEMKVLLEHNGALATILLCAKFNKELKRESLKSKAKAAV
ncbi:hypothetical protein ABW19_dt0203312 [Dactylella cylindrospora]|nr:hypothetical protein ABW19_dt0203312 [Dactylella cylindrospora]